MRGGKLPGGGRMCGGKNPGGWALGGKISGRELGINLIKWGDDWFDTAGDDLCL